MIRESLIKLYMRDIAKLRAAIEAYEDESNIWRVGGGVTNSAGNLCLHLIGNLKTYFGAELGNTGYIRERDKEFSENGVPREELLKGIDEAREVVAKVLDEIRPETFWDEYPLVVFETKMTTGYFLIHLATHLNWHLGQIDYHRRLLDQSGALKS